MLIQLVEDRNDDAGDGAPRDFILDAIPRVVVFTRRISLVVISVLEDVNDDEVLHEAVDQEPSTQTQHTCFVAQLEAYNSSKRVSMRGFDWRWNDNKDEFSRLRKRR